jgi:23S rRNA maturation mini-RNase III
MNPFAWLVHQLIHPATGRKPKLTRRKRNAKSDTAKPNVNLPIIAHRHTD